jgi:ABC-type transport system substrate-binding protein
MPHAIPKAPSAPGIRLSRCCRALLLAGITLQALSAEARTLTIGVSDPVTSADMHISDTTSNFALTGHVFETLAARDAQLRLRPGLAEAGFPRGFRLTLSTPNDRYPSGARSAQAVAQFWTRIGVRREAGAMPWGSYLARDPRQGFASRLGGWGSSTGEAPYLLRNVLGTYGRAKGWGSPNFSCHSNPDLDALTTRAITILDTAATAASFNVSNRINSALGVAPNQEAFAAHRTATPARQRSDIA